MKSDVMIGLLQFEHWDVPWILRWGVRVVGCAMLGIVVGVGSVLAQGTITAEEEEREARLVFLKERAAEYQLVVDADRVARRTPQPVYRWSHPVNITADGALFVWSDDDRPVVLGSMLILRDETLYGEFQSVTPRRLKGSKKGSTVWAPEKPGIEFVRVPNAPQPADSPNERLTQMKLLARRFSAELTKGPPAYSEGSVWRLRLLPKQIVRYGGPQTTVLDGAIFAFCHDTDPEIVLFLEPRGEAGDVAWTFAFAPLTAWQATGKCDENPVWSQPRLNAMNAQKQTYMTLIPTPPYSEARSRQTSVKKESR